MVFNPKSMLIFLLWPFAGLVHVLKNFREKGSKEIFWFFCIFFGFVFIFEDPKLQKFGMDSAYYARNLIDMAFNPIRLGQVVNDVLTFKNDAYASVVTIIVSLFTYDPRYLFVAFATIFGYFYSENTWMVFNQIKQRIDWFLFLLIAIFMLVIPIWNINGVRMYTAAQIFLFGLLKFYLFKEKKGIIFILSTVLVHFSFVFPVIVFLMALLIPRKATNILLILYFISIIFGETDLVSTLRSQDLGANIFQEKINSYTHDDYIVGTLTREQNLNWQVILNKNLFKWSFYVLVFSSFIYLRKLLTRLKITKLANFALLFGSVSNFAANLPSGFRFVIISNFVFSAIFLMLYGNENEGVARKNLNIFLSIPLLYIAIMWVRLGMEFYGLDFFIGNPLTVLVTEKTDPLIIALKKILGM